MERTFAKIDYESFMNALDDATEKGERIRMVDFLAVDEFVSENSIDTTRVHDFSRVLEDPHATIIKTGMMKGFYVYSLDKKKAYLYKHK